MQYTKTIFVDGTAPYINAENLNNMEDAIEALANVATETCEFDTENSTQGLFKLITLDDEPEISGSFVAYNFIPSINNAAGAQCQPTWSDTAIDIYDITTGDHILGGAIRAGIPCTFIYYDGIFWVNGHGGGAFRLSSPDNNDEYEPGTFSRTNTNPNGVTKLGYNGFLYATQMFAKTYNCPQKECLALGYNVTGIDPDDSSAMAAAVGSVVALSGSSEYEINHTANSENIVGVITEEYVALYGTEDGRVPVAFSGRVNAKVDGACNAGDYLVASSTTGCLEVIDYNVASTVVVAQAIADKSDTSVGLCPVILVNMPYHNGDSSGTFIISNGTDGSFSRTGNDPIGTTPLEYNGYLYATKLTATNGFENPSGNNVAFGYPINAAVEVGDIIAVNSSGSFVINSIKNNPNVIGIVSGDYGAIYGTNFGNSAIVTSGRAYAKVKGTCSVGDFLVGSDTAGYLEVKDSASDRWYIVAQALEDKAEVPEEEDEEESDTSDLVLVRITFMSLYNGKIHVNPDANNIAEMYEITSGEENDAAPEAGDLIAMDIDGNFVVNEIYNTNTPIGIVSDDYAALYGTATNGVPVATFGRIQAKVYGACERGDYLVGSEVRGCLEVADANAPRGSIIAMSLGHKDIVEPENPSEAISANVGSVLVRIVNM